MMTRADACVLCQALMDHAIQRTPGNQESVDYLVDAGLLLRVNGFYEPTNKARNLSFRARGQPMSVGEKKADVDSTGIDEVIEMLNEAFEADPNAMQCLLANRVPCNNALANHPEIIVDSPPVLAGHVGTGAQSLQMRGHWQVGMLGVINGIMTVLGLPLIAAKFSDPVEPGGRSQLEGFCRYVPPAETPHAGV